MFRTINSSFKENLKLRILPTSRKKTVLHVIFFFFCIFSEIIFNNGAFSFPGKKRPTPEQLSANSSAIRRHIVPGGGASQKPNTVSPANTASTIAASMPASFSIDPSGADSSQRDGVSGSQVQVSAASSQKKTNARPRVPVSGPKGNRGRQIVETVVTLPAQPLSTQPLAAPSSSTSAIPAPKPLNLSNLPLSNSYPEEYTLLRVDSSRIPLSTEKEWSEITGFEEIGPRFLQLSFAESKFVSFAKTKEEAKGKSQWLRKQESKGEENYYVIQLFGKPAETRAAKFLRSLTGNDKQNHDDEFEFRAGLLIFPGRDTTAMIYGFGQWWMVLNKDCIVPRWGLRVIASAQICNPSAIKEVFVQHIRKPNPTLKKETAAKPQPIEDFGLETASEELQTMRLKPNRSIATNHLLIGDDSLNFTLSAPRKKRTGQVKESNDQSSVDSGKDLLALLHHIASTLDRLTNDEKFQIHSRMREYIDEEINPTQYPDLIENLNKKLIEKLQEQGDKEVFIFVHRNLWRELKSRNLRFGKKAEEGSIFKAISEHSLKDLIEVRREGCETPKKMRPEQILYSLPIEHEEKFYRFDRGRWYEIDASRLESIRRIMRKRKQPRERFRLPAYTDEDARPSGQKSSQQSTKGNGLDYQEERYNSRAVAEIRKGPNWEALLLDRLNIALAENANTDKFEFADLLVVDPDKNIYVVHVKRREANALSHLNEQARRCAEFLTTELNRKNGRKLLVEAYKKELYAKNDIPITANERQKQEILESSLFLSKYKEWKKKKAGEALSAILATQEKGAEVDFLSKVSPHIDREFFKTYHEDLALALDALFTCFTKGALLNKIEDTAKKFLVAVKRAINIREILFPQGSHLNLGKIKVVIAIVNDKVREGKPPSTLDQCVIFKSQDLWGIDLACTTIEKAGLEAIVTVIGDYTGTYSQKDKGTKVTTKVTADPFGPINPQKTVDSQASGKEPEIPFEFGSQAQFASARDTDTDSEPSEEEDEPTSRAASSSSGAHALSQLSQRNSSSTQISTQAPESQQTGAAASGSGAAAHNDLESLLQRASTTDFSGDLDVVKVQKLECTSSGSASPSSSLPPTYYYTIPTVGDGYCLFHALLTDQGKSVRDVREEAETMKASLASDKCVEEFRAFVFQEGCKAWLVDDNSNIEIPETIREKMQEKKEYMAAYEAAKRDCLGGSLDDPDIKYPDEPIQKLLSSEYIQNYMSRFGGAVDIPFRPDVTCPVAVLARLSQKKIRIFTFNTDKKELRLLKEAGEQGPIVNILHAGNHYTRLLCEDEIGNDTIVQQCQQIWRNFLSGK